MYIRHTGGAAWGVGVLVAQTRDQRTYVFTDGVRRTFKAAVADKLVVPAPPPSDEDCVRLARGKASGGTAMPVAVNLALEAAIRADPDEPGDYSVYADWLQQRKDPRGELIAVHAGLAREPDNAKLRAAEAALLAAHGAYFVPEAVDRALRLPRRAGDDPRARCEIEWRMGFIARARLAKKVKQQLDLVAVVAQLVGHPSSTLLRELVLGPLGTPEGYDYAPLVAAIAAAQPASIESPGPAGARSNAERCGVSIKSLVIGDFTTAQLELRYARAGDLARLMPALPALRRLVARAGKLGFASVPSHPGLRELRVIGELEAADRDRLFAAALPALVTLELGGDRVQLSATDVAALATNPSLGGLRELIVRHGEGTEAMLDTLIASPLLSRLDTLVLADGDLTDDAVHRLAPRAGKLAHLATLDLSGNPTVEAARLGAVATRHANPGLTEAAVLRRTDDPRNAAAARELAVATKWLALGRDGSRVWGEYEGRDHYYVFAQLDARPAGCSCGSTRSPCKHALALLLLAARGHAFVERPPPEALLRHARIERPRYAPVWE